MKAKKKKMSTKGDINITPLIDVLLVLLVIFMTITPLTPKGLDAAVPQPPPPNVPPPPDANKTIILSVRKEGDKKAIKINQEVITMEDLGQRLADIFKTRNDRTAFVSGDPDLIFDDVIQVIDIAKGNGVDKVGLMTEPLALPPVK